jgi:hypothetical protein
VGSGASNGGRAAGSETARHSLTVLDKCIRSTGWDRLLRSPAAPSAEEIVPVGDGPNCLTAPQVEAIRKITQGPPIRATNACGRLYPERADWASSRGAEPYRHRDRTCDVVLQDPTWGFRTTLDPDRRVARTRSVGPCARERRTDISPFSKAESSSCRAAGTTPSSRLEPSWTYRNVEAAVGAASARQAVRLYMVPG